MDTNSSQVTVDPSKDLVFDELKTIETKINSCKGLPEDLKQKALQMLQRVNRMAKLGSYSTEFEVLAKYVDVIVQIPWDVRTDDKLDIEYAKNILETLS